jgi:hypothetical protein
MQLQPADDSDPARLEAHLAQAAARAVAAAAEAAAAAAVAGAGTHLVERLR